MGRYKLPKEVKELRGTKRKSRENESGAWLEQASSNVTVPADLKGDAAKIYKERVAMLYAMRLLQPIDIDALRLYSCAMASAIKLQREIDKEGFTVIEKDEDGQLCKVSVNPLVKVLKDMINTANTIGSQFGWSPISRMRLQSIVKEEEKKDDFNGLLNGK